VIRDLMLEIIMAPAVSLDVPMHLRYRLRESEGEWSIERLCAHWELSLMVVQMLSYGTKSLPPSLRLSVNLLRNQGLIGTAGFVRGSADPAGGTSVASKHFSTRPWRVTRWRRGARQATVRLSVLARTRRFRWVSWSISCAAAAGPN